MTKLISILDSNKHDSHNNYSIEGALAKFQKSKYYLEKQIGMLTGNINSDV